jgi:Kdo2-lipid IVA lauroyltransferase/acyltransferase
MASSNDDQRSGRHFRMTTLAQAAEFYALRGVVRAMEWLSWPRAGALGARLGELGYRPLGIRRAVVEQQIAAAFPAMPADEVQRVARAAYRHLGRNAAEIALAPRLGRQGIIDLYEEVVGFELIDSALAAGRGCVLTTGHIGNYELGGAYVAARGIPIDAIARRQANPLFNQYITETRAAMGMVVLQDFEAVKRSARSLRDNRLVAFIADQGVKGLASTFVPFFGRPAKTPRGPAVFAVRLGSPMVFAASVRLPNGRFRLQIESVPVADTGDRERDIDTTVACFTSALERVVRQYPEQYFWHHRRWRRQPPPSG